MVATKFLKKCFLGASSTKMGLSYTPVLELEQLGPIVELLQEAVSQLRSLAEEVLLEGRKSSEAQRPQQLLLAEERVVAEQAAQSRVLGHDVAVGRV